MRKESDTIKRMSTIINLLVNEYPNSKCSLAYNNAYQLLVATILSAQCTDQRVNRVVAPMFKKYPTPKSFSRLSLKEIKKLIFSTGFYNNKAKSIKAMTDIIMKEFDGDIPSNINDLVKLPGVGRKTANVVLGTFYKIPSIVVDTHVTRLTNLLGFCDTQNAVIIERELSKFINKKYWVKFTHLIIDHGRKVCIANRPKCDSCILADYCPSAK
mgnify:CR=1 FL=1